MVVVVVGAEEVEEVEGSILFLVGFSNDFQTAG